MKKALFFILIILSASVYGQEMKRPAIWGIAKITFLVSDMQMARDYYGRFLGFDEAFSYDSPRGKVVSFKVNDRQFLEFIEDNDAINKKRMVSYSLETDDVEGMRFFLQQKGIKVPDKVTKDAVGNDSFELVDNSGNVLEFLNMNEDGLYKRSKGKFLSERRISKRIHHIGIYAEKIDENDPLYVQALGLYKIVRYPEDASLSPKILYLGFNNCIENIEFYSPNNPNFCHPCFVVDDMQETIYTLKERQINEVLNNPGIGYGKRWLLNLMTPDKTKVEFTEPFTIR
ncbi:VOC family protein [Coprobacter secundus]|uniref:VOC domain-containing protein n=1 Tax=Coprobacter secundus subsp. similis TaxID=2751153 RepID=A0A7G1HZS5_9BACT|nr:VOC family protein [Coprobacter secundus]BCI63944.1 hypothetical protein Cop2CBH44_22970 [Coprobacter secundus subsp. similis]